MMIRVLSTLAAIALLAGLSACDKEKEVDPPAELVEMKPRIEIDKVWSTGVGGDTKALRLGLRPASDGERLYAASHDGDVFALDPKNGRTVWRAATKLALAGGPGVGSGRVVAGSSEGDVIALDAADGKQVWKVRVRGEVLAPPAVGSDIVVVRTVDGRLVGLNLAGRAGAVEYRAASAATLAAGHRGAGNHRRCRGVWIRQRQGRVGRTRRR